jgi:hypothetical protein
VESSVVGVGIAAVEGQLDGAGPSIMIVSVEDLEFLERPATGNYCGGKAC